MQRDKRYGEVSRLQQRTRINTPSESEREERALRVVASLRRRRPTERLQLARMMRLDDDDDDDDDG